MIRDECSSQQPFVCAFTSRKEYEEEMISNGADKSISGKDISGLVSLLCDKERLDKIIRDKKG